LNAADNEPDILDILALPLKKSDEPNQQQRSRRSDWRQDRPYVK
jgi:hypothetical protein